MVASGAWLGPLLDTPKAGRKKARAFGPGCDLLAECRSQLLPSPEVLSLPDGPPPSGTPPLPEAPPLPGVSLDGRFGRRCWRLGGRPSTRASWAGRASGLASDRGPLFFGPWFRSGRRPCTGDPERFSGMRSACRSDSRFPGAVRISSSFSSSHCSSVRSRSGMALSSRIRRRGSIGSGSFMSPL